MTFHFLRLRQRHRHLSGHPGNSGMMGVQDVSKRRTVDRSFRTTALLCCHSGQTVCFQTASTDTGSPRRRSGARRSQRTSRLNASPKTLKRGRGFDLPTTDLSPSERDYTGSSATSTNAALPTTKPRLPETKRPAPHPPKRTKQHAERMRRAHQKAREERNKTTQSALEQRLAFASRIEKSSAALRNQSMRQRARSSVATLCAGRGEERDPTWLEHTLEIKDDQNKGSQTGGE